jgi:hypothetical protein
MLRTILPQVIQQPKQKTKIYRKGVDFMQLEKAEREKNNAQSSRFTQRIGSTIFTVNIISKEGSPETLDDKMLRLMKSDLEFGENRENRGAKANPALKKAGKYGMMVMPQADWLPGRSSV